MFTIEIGVLESGLHNLTFELAAEELELDPTTFDNVRVGARLDVSERRILVSLTARATATLECDRTLRLFDQEIEGAYDMLFAPAGFVGDEDAYDEVRVLDQADQQIDLTDAVRDTLLLAIPSRCVAPGAEEEEIPTIFGAPDDEEEGEVDPRWAALKPLRQKDKQK